MTYHRRHFLRLATAGTAALFTTPGAFAEKLSLTPRMTEGPFYPDQMPLDTDNDLLIPFNPLKGSTTGELAARFDMVIGLTPADPG